MSTSIPAHAAETPAGDTATSIPATLLPFNHVHELLAPPEPGADYRLWREGMLKWREEQRAVLAKLRQDLDDPYALPQLQWTQTSFMQIQMMSHERYFYDPATRKYTVNRLLDDLENRYGGIDSVLVWPTYPNIGVDNRNQYDLWRDMPGGLEGVRKMVADFHRRDVRVFVPIMFWDHGTREEGMPMPDALAKLCMEIGADGLNGDTMSGVTRDFYDASVKINYPLVMEPENGMSDIQMLAWNTMTWGYFFPYQAAPGVNKFRWVEPRHMTHTCDRWAHNRTDMLQYAFFNGAGHQAWENVWGVWNGITPRDGEVIRRIQIIYKALPHGVLSSDDYEPHYPTLKQGVYATRFPSANGTLYTIVNRTSDALDEPLLEVADAAGSQWYDLWNGSGKVTVTPGANGAAAIRVPLDPNGYAAVFQAKGELEKMAGLLSAMADREKTPLASLSNEWRVLQQRIVPIAKTSAATTAPEGMVRIPAGRFVFEVEGVMIEQNEGVGVQFPWEDQPELKHVKPMDIATFYIDKYPVTCAQFKKFVDATNYRPADDHNFLKGWNGTNLPDGYAKKPVTWVSMEDARAYAAWAGKRLPHDWEWQFAAQGSDGRLFPWGSKDPARVPAFHETRTQPPPDDVDAHPAGASPFGVMDLVGNVWQWTDEFHDDHTRAALLRGGSNYRPTTSHWYFPQAHELNKHGKYLLMSPSLDRSATIGFRCVADAK
ncbi:MAG: formylglycine-generating enzyme family protein [Candidatus Sumerlaeaceae bacterium]